MQTLRCPLLVSSVLMLVTLLTATPSMAQDHVVGVGVEFHSDDGELDGQERIAVQAPKQEDRSFSRESSTAFSLWYLGKFSDSLRWGGGLRYYGTYTLVEDVPEDTDQDDIPDPEEFGSWTELFTQVEWSTPILAKQPLEFVLGLQLGVIAFSPSGAFEEEINRLKEQDVSVWESTRLGFLFGPQVGARYSVGDFLALRLDFGIRYNRLFLFSTTEEVNGVAFSKEWDLNILRTSGTLGVEVTF